jgi:6,7-dimethyl-8-ribityllumazine synthase
MTAKKTGNSISRSVKINNPKKIKIACVISEWHIEITESFYRGALKKFSEFGFQKKILIKYMFQVVSN